MPEASCYDEENDLLAGAEVHGMAKYQVWLVARPQGWTSPVLDDVPPRPGTPRGVLGEDDDLFAAVRRAIEHNQTAQAGRSPDWAVVVEPGSPGGTWREARRCTPLSYRVAAIWWPTGWEPQSPGDVPNCVWRAQGETDPAPLSYAQASAAVRGLNQQSMDHASPLWYVVVAVEDEPVSQTVSYEPSGTETTVQVRRLHLVRPDDAGRGDCSHCPAHGLQCVRAGSVE